MPEKFSFSMFVQDPMRIVDLCRIADNKKWAMNTLKAMGVPTIPMRRAILYGYGKVILEDDGSLVYIDEQEVRQVIKRMKGLE